MGVPICHLRQSAPLGLLYYYARFQNYAPTVRGATGFLNLCTKAVRTPVRQRKSARCTEPYSGFTKMPFASEFFPRGGVLPCALSGLYTYCTRYHTTAQFVYKECGTSTVT